MDLFSLVVIGATAALQPEDYMEKRGNVKPESDEEIFLDLPGFFF